MCGESPEAPPPPPSGILYCWWEWFHCYKHPVFDYIQYRGPTAVDTHIVRWQSPDFPLTLRWNPDSIRAMCDSAILFDSFGGWFFRRRMDVDSEYTMDYSVSDRAMIIRHGARPPAAVRPTETLVGEYWLGQNYPNPWNPSTTIAYRVPRRCFVLLTVFDILGRQVAQLVNETQGAGHHEATLRADNLASGIYYYRLRADGHNQAKAMVLLR